jgi:predicted P-loop ATPase
MDLVWAQAVYLFENKFTYWFNELEILELHQHNAEFSVISQEEELFQYYFSDKIPTGSIDVLKKLPASIILSKLETNSRLKLSIKKLGESLRKLGFKPTQIRDGIKRVWVYEVYEKTHNEIQLNDYN